MYKIIHNNKVIDIVRFPRFIKFLSTGHIAITDKSSAHGIVGSDGKTLYSFSATSNKKLPIVVIEPINNEEEFSKLASLLNSGKVVIADAQALEAAKCDAINELSNVCKNTITAGFDIKLSDDEVYNFKLTTEDQLNLMLIENQMASGTETFVYHATDQPCKIFNKSDMLKILQAFRQFVLYHTTYFNAAKHYVKALTDIEEVNLFTYGTDISEAVDDKVLKQILRNGGAVR